MRTLLGLIFSEGAFRAIGTVSLISLAALLMFWIFSMFSVVGDSVSLDLPPPPPHQNQGMGTVLKPKLSGFMNGKIMEISSGKTI